MPRCINMEKLKYNTSKVRQMWYTLVDIPAISQDSKILIERSSDPVYVIINGQKNWVRDTKSLEQYGGWNAVKVGPNGTLQAIPSGAEVS